MSNPSRQKLEELRSSSIHPDDLHPDVWRVSAVAILGSLISNLDATVVNVSLPSLSVELHTTLSTIQWVSSGYLLALALMLPLSGWLVDRVGARTVYLWCFSAFTLSSILCGLSWSAGSLIGFRLLQGMSGGLLAPMSQMMIARVAGRQMARVMSMAALPVLIGPILGPVLAGSILQHASWRWIFFINLPFGILAIALAVLFLPNDQEDIRPRMLDLTGLAMLSPSLVLFLYGIDHIGERWGIVAFVVSLVLIMIFLCHAQRKREHALIDLSLFQNQSFYAATAVQFLSNGINFAVQMLIPFYLVRLYGLAPGKIGLMMAPLGLGMVITYLKMGAVTQRIGVRRLVLTGIVLSIVGLLPFLFRPPFAVLAIALFIRGLGVSAIGIPSISAAYEALSRQDLPMATTSLNIVQRVGGPTLMTIAATFLAWRMHIVPDHLAFLQAFLLLIILNILLALAARRLPLHVA